MTATSEQLDAMGRAARSLLLFAWSREPRIDLLVTNSLIAVTKTFATDPLASAALVRRAIEAEHLREHGYKELRWIAEKIGIIAANDVNLAVDIYRAAYGYAEASGDTTNMGTSALLSLHSNRRQDYEAAWFQLAQGFPALLNQNLEAGVRALARGLDGYVQRQNRRAYPGEPTATSFSLNGSTSHFRSDFSHSWFRAGYQPRQDAPLLLSKFEEHLRQIARNNDASVHIQRIMTTLAGESGLAAIWASLLVVGGENPESLASGLVPLACAEPIMLSSDTRYQLGVFLTAAYSHLSDDERVKIEEAILSLAGEQAERAKLVLAGCIPEPLIATPNMRSFVEQSDQTGISRPNIPPVQFTSSFRAFDTDAYLQSEGVSLDEPESTALRDLMRAVEEHSAPGQITDLASQSVRNQLRSLKPLYKGLSERFVGKVPDTLFEHAAGLLAEAASKLARAEPAVLKARPIRQALKDILLFSASSANPHFDADQENNFHENLSWGGQSARTAAAHGLLDLIRTDKRRNPKIMTTVRNLARDRVAHVRLQIIQNLGQLRILDPTWAWSELDFVLAQEPTRGVVAAAIVSLGVIAYLDIPRTIHLATRLIRRYRNKTGSGMAHCRFLAEMLIFDIHIHTENAEAETFASKLSKSVIANDEVIKQLIARYSDNLLSGSSDDQQNADNGSRKKTLAFYRVTTERAFAEIESRSTKFDVRKFNTWPEVEQAVVHGMFGILDEISMRLYFASIDHYDGSAPSTEVSSPRARLYREGHDLFARLAGAIVAPIAHHLIQALEAFIPLDPPGVFAMITQAVRSAEQGGYALESMAADLFVRIVERYLADYRSVFADRARLNDLMDCLDVFVRAGWPGAQSLTFRLGEIWR
jgi:hypothetical protein